MGGQAHLTLANAADAIESVVNCWGVFMDSSKPYEQAEAVRALQDAVSDLKTWHPRYDSDRNEITEQDSEGTA